ncbi:conserved hypothetical protein (DUF368) [Alteracholeplasma palmae J233]|uniref:DUF368 domain-containing protein n=1 Tax=Alteracholeplasma palmae (strain ATCC 49389 / J233) TaxID=1318466 RepID=U4KRE0_ALTPJ|nr:DUF368 domain-containing protein [Alteracholeplasma palmae]CCV64081.1 conserved hypothetical protein (DUF368) [Alteracholeplasma palmae J233]
MNNIKKISKSILVGIGAILPGVSGGMIAASFNIYKDLIEALNKVTKHPIKAVLSIWQYLVGIFIGVLLGFLLVKILFKYIPIESTLLFIGLILGGIPEILFFARKKEYDFKAYLTSAIGFLLMIAVIFLNNLSTGSIVNTNIFIWIVVGFIVALSFIIPGISGTMILLVLGFYKPLLDLATEVMKEVSTFKFHLLKDNILDMLAIVIGLILAVILLSKLVSILLNKKPERFYQFVLGIIIASPINIIYSLNNDLGDGQIFDFSKYWLSWLIGIALIPLGVYIARIFAKGEKDETKEN